MIIRRSVSLAPLLAAACGLWAAEQPAVRQPVFVQLFAKVDDYYEIKVTEDRIRRALDMARALREKHAAVQAPLTLYFNGAMAEALFQRKTDTLVQVRKAVDDGLVEIGYDGVDEPTPTARPRPNFRKSKTAHDRWLARSEALDWFLTEWKDPVDGEPVPAKTGGLKRVIEVFGKVTAIQGVTLELGGDPETVHLLQRFNQRYIGFGLPEGNTFPARNLHGFGGGVAAVAQLLSPEAATSPEVFWLNGVLRQSDNNGSTVHRRQLADRKALETMTAAIDRARPHFLKVEVADYGRYYKPQTPPAVLANPLRYAYDNPKVPNFGVQMLNAPPQVEETYSKDGETLDWLAQFLASNPGSRFLSPSLLLAMAAPAQGPVSKAGLLTAVQGMLRKWDEYRNYVPEYASDGTQYFSPADMFYLLAHSLADLRRTGSLPESVTAKHVYGPLEAPSSQGPSQGSIETSAILQAAEGVSRTMTAKEWKPLPDNHIPGWISAGALRVNSAQFLRLMAYAFESAALSKSTASFELATCEMPSPVGLVFPTTRLGEDMGATWTLKPAPLKLD